MYLKEEKEYNKLIELCENCEKNEDECSSCDTEVNLNKLETIFNTKSKRINDNFIIINALGVLYLTGKVIISEIRFFPEFLDSAIHAFLARAYLIATLEVVRYISFVVFPIMLGYLSLSAIRNILEVKKKTRWKIYVVATSIFIFFITLIVLLSGQHFMSIKNIVFSNIIFWGLVLVLTGLNLHFGE